MPHGKSVKVTCINSNMPCVGLANCEISFKMLWTWGENNVVKFANDFPH